MVPVMEWLVPGACAEVLVCNVLCEAQKEATCSFKVSGESNSGVIKVLINSRVPTVFRVLCAKCFP